MNKISAYEFQQLMTDIQIREELKYLLLSKNKEIY